MNIKKRLDIAGQKAVGVVQQIKGEAEIRSGQKIKGTIDRFRGKANESVADLRIKLIND